MKNTNRKGFTLIELLVVIAIIGLLSTMAVISLNSARAKARDARRLSDVKQLSTMLSLAAADDPTANVDCGAVGTECAAGNLTTAAVGPGQVGTEFSKFSDPTGTAACTLVSTAPCAYSFAFTEPGGNRQNVGSTTIIFYLENDSGGLSAGPNVITTEGIFNP